MARLGHISWQIEQMAGRIEAEEQTARVRDLIVNLLALAAVFGAGFLIGSALLAWSAGFGAGFWTGLALMA